MTIIATVPEVEATTTTIKASELARVLKNAKLFASKDTARPILTYTEVRFTAEGLKFISTDSHAMLIETLSVPVPSDQVGQTRYIGHFETAPLLASLKAAIMVTLEPTTQSTPLLPPEVLTITSVAGGPTYTFGMFGMFPNWETLFTAALIEGGTGTTDKGLGLGLAQLKRIGSLTLPDKGEVSTPAVLRSEDGSLKCVAFTIGSDIVVIQMPVRF